MLATACIPEDRRMDLAAAIYAAFGKARIMRPIDLIVWTTAQWAGAATSALGRRVRAEGRQLFLH